MIKAPEHNFKAEVARTIVEAFAQSNPLTGAAARIFQFTKPTQYEKERDDWISEITDQVNAHGDELTIFREYLFPKISISEDALALAKLLIDSSDKGLSDGADFEKVKRLLPDISEEDLEVAIAELQHYGFVDFKFGQLLSIKNDFYVAFDGLFNNVDVPNDAKALAKLLLDDKENHNIYKLFEKVSWERRRFNPALGYLLESLPQIQRSDEIQPDFITTFIFLDADAVFSLRNFLK